MSTRIKVGIKLLITVGLLGLLFYRMDLKAFLEVLRSANWWFVALSCVLYFCTAFFVTTRWKVILVNFGVGTPWRRLFHIYLIGYFFNMFMPSAIGGDFFRAYYLAKREQTGMSTAITTTVLDRFAGLSALLLIGLVASALNPIEIEGRSLTWVFLLVAALFIAALILMFTSRSHRLLKRILARVKWGEVEQKATSILDGMERLRRNSMAIIWVMLLSVSVQLLVVVVIWCAALSLHFEAQFRWFLLFIPIINLATAIPLTINGVGLREGVYFLLFSQIGVPMESAVTLSLINLFVYAVTSVVGGVAYSLYKKEQPFSLEQMTAE